MSFMETYLLILGVGLIVFGSISTFLLIKILQSGFSFISPEQNDHNDCVIANPRKIKDIKKERN